MENNKSFWTRKISIWHIVYISVIFIIMTICVLCIIPGRINDEAYQNFSFAATITSIVLAVVSIVYSLQSGLSSVGQLNSIKNIEYNINEEIKRFTNLESSIKNVVSEIVHPIQTSMGDIQQRQADIQKSQDDLTRNWREFSVSLGASTENQDYHTNDNNPKISIEDKPQIFAIILYTCLCSNEKDKDIPYHILSKFFGVRSFYCEGVINSISIFNPTAMSVGIGSKQTRQKITKYDESILGTKTQLATLIMKGTNKTLGENILNTLNNYYECDDAIS